jgi:hypothetical protein
MKSTMSASAEPHLAVEGEIGGGEDLAMADLQRLFVGQRQAVHHSIPSACM